MSSAPPSPTTSRPDAEARPPEARWRRTIDHPPHKSVMLPESGHVVTLNHDGLLYRTSSAGEHLWQRRLGSPASTFAASHDGSTFIVFQSPDRVLVLDGRGEPLRQVRVSEVPDGPDPVTALAADLVGQRLAVCMRDGRVTIMDERGRVLATVENEFPLAMLSFVAGAPLVVGAASFGQLVVLDYAGRVHWSDRLKMSVGSVATSGEATVVLVAGFATGVHRYSSVGEHEGAYLVSGSTHRVAVRWDGEQFVVGTGNRQMVLLSRQGHVLWTLQADREIVDVGIDALGRRAFYSTTDGELVYVDLAPSEGLSDAPAAIEPERDRSARPEPATAAPPRAPTDKTPPADRATRTLRAAWAFRLPRSGGSGRDVQMALGPNGRYAALVGADGRLRILGPDGDRVMPPEDVAGRHVRLQSADDVPRFLAASTRDVVWVDPSVGSVTRPESGQVDALAVRLGAHGRHVALAYQDGTLHLVRADGSRCWQGRQDKAIRRLNVTRRGYVAVVTRNRDVCVFDPDGTSCLEIPGHQPPWRFLAPCGDGLVVLAGNGRVVVVDGEGRIGEEHDLRDTCEACQVLGSGCVIRLTGDIAVHVSPDGTLSGAQPVPGACPVWCDAPGHLSWIRVAGRRAAGHRHGREVRWTFDAAGPILDVDVTPDGGTVLARTAEAVYGVRVSPGDDAGEG